MKIFQVYYLKGKEVYQHLECVMKKIQNMRMPKMMKKTMIFIILLEKIKS